MTPCSLIDIQKQFAGTPYFYLLSTDYKASHSRQQRSHGNSQEKINFTLKFTLSLKCSEPSLIQCNSGGGGEVFEMKRQSGLVK
jgi:hypothetical protein